MKLVLSLALAALSLLGQAPQNPPQPATQFYGVAALNTFPTYNRASYLAATGHRAPPCDATRPMKTWFDSTVDVSTPGNVALYRHVTANRGGNGYSETQYVLLASAAAGVNLPGYEVYPKATPPDATAIVGTFFGTTGQTPNPIYLSTPEEAAALAGELGGTVAQEPPLGGLTWNFGTDARRFFDVVVGGKPFNAGQLLYSQLYKNGIGAPGAWDQSGNNDSGLGPVFVPTPTVVCDLNTPPVNGVPYPFALAVDVPVRPLLPNEELTAGTFGNAQVTRTDLQAAADAQADNFTVADRATLDRVLQLLEAR